MFTPLEELPLGARRPELLLDARPSTGDGRVDFRDAAAFYDVQARRMECLGHEQCGNQRFNVASMCVHATRVACSSRFVQKRAKLVEIWLEI